MRTQFLLTIFLSTMSHTITINDESTSGKILNKIMLKLEDEITTIGKIIEARVNYEVDDYNKKSPNLFKGLVQPTDAEQTLNGFRMLKRKKIDPEKQVYTALQSFNQNGFFVLVDNKQYENLDDEVLLEKDTTVSFIKLTPLVGG